MRYLSSPICTISIQCHGLWMDKVRNTHISIQQLIPTDKITSGILGVRENVVVRLVRMMCLDITVLITDLLVKNRETQNTESFVPDKSLALHIVLVIPGTQNEMILCVGVTKDRLQTDGGASQDRYELIGESFSRRRGLLAITYSQFPKCTT